MMGLSRRQSDLLNFIKSYAAKHDLAPSYAEMMEAIGLKSKSNVHALLTILEARGHIRRLPSHVRAIELTDTSRTVPLNKEIHALTMRYALEHGISVETATNELLRQSLGATA